MYSWMSSKYYTGGKRSESILLCYQLNSIINSKIGQKRNKEREPGQRIECLGAIFMSC